MVQGEWSFLPFFIGAIAIGVIVTPLFNGSGGSILLPLVLHWQLVNPAFPDAAPHDTIFFVIAAVVVTIIHRKTMFSGDAAVIEVIPAPRGSVRR